MFKHKLSEYNIFYFKLAVRYFSRRISNSTPAQSRYRCMQTKTTFMRKKAFDILDYISADKIIATLERLGQEPMTKTAHGFKDYGAITIKDAANQSTLNFTNKFKLKPAIGLISVVLAANREYNKVVEPNLDRIERERPDLKNFTQLSEIISTKTKDEFFIFWGHRDDKKYATLTNVLTKIRELKNVYPDTHTMTSS